MSVSLEYWAWARETGRLLRLWGDAERLCCAILHRLDWRQGWNHIDERQRLEKTLERARQRSNRRYQAMRDYERSR